MANKITVIVDSNIKMSNGRYLHTHNIHDFESVGKSSRKFTRDILDKVFNNIQDIGTIYLEIRID